MDKPTQSGRKHYDSSDFARVIHDSVKTALDDLQLNPKLVTAVVEEIANHMRVAFAGNTIYIPKGRPDAGETAAEVYNDWTNGLTVQQIVEKTGFTYVYIYRLLARERNRLRGIRQQTKSSLTK